MTAITPTDLSPTSQALCAHYPFVEETIDFKKLKNFKGKFFMNSYCIETGKSQQFDKDQDEIGPEHFFAALSYPFIYAPTRIGNNHYYEGAAHDPLNLPKYHRLCCKNAIGLLVIVDLLGAYKKALIRTPTNLLDAYRNFHADARRRAGREGHDAIHQLSQAESTKRTKGSPKQT